MLREGGEIHGFVLALSLLYHPQALLLFSHHVGISKESLLPLPFQDTLGPLISLLILLLPLDSVLTELLQSLSNGLSSLLERLFLEHTGCQCLLFLDTALSLQLFVLSLVDALPASQLLLSDLPHLLFCIHTSSCVLLHLLAAEMLELAYLHSKLLEFTLQFLLVIH